MPPGDRPARAYAELSSELERTVPSCDGDWRFTLDKDDLDADELPKMRGICNRCPVFPACVSYAHLARPTGGFWAGTHYKPKGRKQAA